MKWYTSPLALPPVGQPIDLSDSRYGQIQMKFNFSNRRHIPPGIVQRERGKDADVDAANQKKAGDIGATNLAVLNKIRPGRVDTGQQVYRNLPMTQIALTRAGLRRMGFGLHDLHFYEHYLNDGSLKFVVAAVFIRVKTNEPSQRLSADKTQALTLLAEDAAWFCHVYDNLWLSNPNFNPEEPDTWMRNVTVNTAKLTWLINPNGTPNQIKPRYVVAVRQQQLGVYEVRRIMTAEEEEREVTEQTVFDLFETLGVNPKADEVVRVASKVDEASSRHG